MTTSFIFCNKSFLTRLGLPHLSKIGGSKSYSWLLNLLFQFLRDVRKKVYCRYFDLKRLIAACVPLLEAYFFPSFLTLEGILVFYKKPFFPFSLVKLPSSAFTANASLAVTFAVASTNSEISV